MPCVYFQAVTDLKRRTTAGVIGYCLGDSDGKLRIPSMEEYEKFCMSHCQEGCLVFDFKARDELTVRAPDSARLSESAKS